MRCLKFVFLILLAGSCFLLAGCASRAQVRLVKKMRLSLPPLQQALLLCPCQRPKGRLEKPFIDVPVDIATGCIRKIFIQIGKQSAAGAKDTYVDLLLICHGDRALRRTH